MKKAILLTAFLGLGALYSSAQKYGHLNFGNLIASLPETEAANKELEAYQKQLVAKGEEMATTWQKKAQAFAQKAQAGEMAPVEQQKQQKALEDERGKIIEYESEVQEKIQQKRQELLGPIIERAETAIQEVAKENGYVMIFDTSIFNAILFAQESEDLMGPVKAKLGIE